MEIRLIKSLVQLRTSSLASLPICTAVDIVVPQIHEGLVSSYARLNEGTCGRNLGMRSVPWGKSSTASGPLPANPSSSMLLSDNDRAK